MGLNVTRQGNLHLHHIFHLYDSQLRIYIIIHIIVCSEGHLRQMRLFAENPHSVIDEFSRDFERGFLEILSHRHGTKRVLANRVYQEYIGDKHHVHMNSTMWSSLTGLCKYLGREGKAVVDETEKGAFVANCCNCCIYV